MRSLHIWLLCLFAGTALAKRKVEGYTGCQPGCGSCASKDTIDDDTCLPSGSSSFRYKCYESVIEARYWSGDGGCSGPPTQSVTIPRGYCSAGGGGTYSKFDCGPLLSPGEIAGIVIGGVVFLGLVGFGIWFFLRRRKQRMNGGGGPGGPGNGYNGSLNSPSSTNGGGGGNLPCIPGLHGRFAVLALTLCVVAFTAAAIGTPDWFTWSTVQFGLWTYRSTIGSLPPYEHDCDIARFFQNSLVSDPDGVQSACKSVQAFAILSMILAMSAAASVVLLIARNKWFDAQNSLVTAGLLAASGLASLVAWATLIGMVESVFADLRTVGYEWGSGVGLSITSWLVSWLMAVALVVGRGSCKGGGGSGSGGGGGGGGYNGSPQNTTAMTQYNTTAGNTTAPQPLTWGQPAPQQVQTMQAVHVDQTQSASYTGGASRHNYDSATQHSTGSNGAGSRGPPPPRQNYDSNTQNSTASTGSSSVGRAPPQRQGSNRAGVAPPRSASPPKPAGASPRAAPPSPRSGSPARAPPPGRAAGGASSNYHVEDED